ncbi:amidase [Sphingomonas koreensis]
MATEDGAILIQRLDLGGTGPRVAIKDCLDIAGCRTCLGSRAFADAEPATRNADVVGGLLRAGAHIVGKTNMHELAYGVTGLNEWHGTPVNPSFPDRVPGGSSSGSAVAVAAGIVDFAIGTDTGGSIRVPAACCGVTGLKPTFARVSRSGAYPATSSLDCVGPLARDVAMIERAMTMIDPTFVIEHRPENVVLGVVQVEADPDILSAVDKAIARSGLRTVPVLLPSFTEAFNAGLAIMAAEMAPLFGYLCGTGKLGPDVDARLRAAQEVTADQLALAEEVRVRFGAQVDQALAGVDALVLPTMPSVPLRIDEAGDAPRTLRMTSLVRPFNLSGHPALSLPLWTAEKLPAGLQLVGAQNDDAALCALAAVIEGAL